MKLQLKRSNVLETGAAKQPTAAQLEHGELAVNYNSSDPAIFLKDSNNNVIRISGVGNIADDGQVELPTSTTPPLNPEAGNLWYNSDEGRLYIYYVDSDSSQWVDASPDAYNPTAVPDVTDPNSQSGTLDDRYLMLNSDNDPVTGGLNITGGNVGIGTTSPATSVHVRDSTAVLTLQADDGNACQVLFGDASDVSRGNITYDNSDESLQFKNNNNTERMRIDSSGNVGVGTTSPGALLDLGTSTPILRFSDSDTTGYHQIQSSNSNFIINADPSNADTGSAISFKVDNSDAMRIDSSGNVGIGTTPAANRKVHIQGTGFTELLVEKSDATTAAIMLAADSGVGSIYTRSTESTTTAIPLTFHTGNNERMRIDSSGNVGIGTLAPSGLLHAETGATTDVYVTSGAANASRIWFGDSANRTEASIQYSNVSDSLSISKTGGTGIVLDSSNRLLVGTPSDSGNSKLIVRGGTSTNIGVLDIQANIASTAIGQNNHAGYLRFKASDSGSSNYHLSYVGCLLDGPSSNSSDIPGALTFGTSSDGSGSPTERMRIDSSGNVGVGTTSPGSILDVRETSTGGSTEIRLFNTDNTNATTQTASIAISPDSRASGARVVAIKENADFSTSAARDISLSFESVLNGTQTERMRIDSSGNVQIRENSNTVSTGASLYLYDLAGSANSTNSSGRIAFYSSDLTDGASIRAEIANYYENSSADSALTFKTYKNSLDERMRIDSSGRLLVGTSSTSESARAILQGNSFSSTGGCILKLSRGNSTPNDGGDLGNIQFTDSGHVFAANISAKRDGGTWTSGSSQPTRLEFSTTADGASSPTERMRISNNGETTFYGTNSSVRIVIGGTTANSLFRADANMAGVHFSTTSWLPTDSNGAVVDNSINLGSSSMRMNTLYAGAGTINTSDANEKQQVRELSASEFAIAQGLKALVKAFKFNEAVESKGDQARIHIGVIAQDVDELFSQNGLNAADYGIWCSDTWYEVDGKAISDEGIPYTEDAEGAVAKTRLGIRYEELLAFMIAAL